MLLLRGVNILARDKLALSGILQTAMGRNDTQEWRHIQFIKRTLEESSLAMATECLRNLATILENLKPVTGPEST